VAKTGEKGEEDPVDIELDFDTLQHAVIHHLDDSRDGAEGEMRRWERAEGDCCQIVVFHHKTHGR
jgi:hypothetical protein